MLAPQVEAPFADDFFELALTGRDEHGPLAQELRDEVGLDVEHRRTGILRVARTESERVDVQRMQRWQAARGLRAEWLEPSELGTREPLLSGVAGRMLAGGAWLADEAQVRGPRLVQALATSAVRNGARILEGTWATAVLVAGGRAQGVMTASGPVYGETVVLSAGIWTAALAHATGIELPMLPVKGQIMSVRSADIAQTPRQVLWSGECYLVPRPDGEIVLGATEEEGNYDPRPTLAGLNRLSESALDIVPAAGRFLVDGIWAGLRPAVPDRYPVVGWAPGTERLMLATAHYRNGILLGPLTGRLVAKDVLEGHVSSAFEAFRPERFGQSALTTSSTGRTGGTAFA
ncbi:MAG: glycine oxidase ThiO [Chloroflexota bacterium]